MFKEQKIRENPDFLLNNKKNASQNPSSERVL